MPAITTKLLPKEELAQRIQETQSKPVPDPGEETKKKRYWLQGIVKNCTQFPLTVRPPSYFEAGRYEVHPTNIPAFSIAHFTAVNGDDRWGGAMGSAMGGPMSGATGGNAWDLPLDSNVQFNVALGFTWPVIGGARSGVIESTNARDGYHSATNGGNKIVSKYQYQGEDTNGKDMAICFEIYCSVGQHPVYIITQVIV